MDLYDIRFIIVAKLDKNDLLSCARVSKRWHELFLPFIYTKCRISDMGHVGTDSGTQPPWLSVQKHLCHLSDFAIDVPLSESMYDLILENCHSLRRLELSSPLQSDFCVRLLKGNPWLTEVRLYEPLEITPEMLEAMVQQCRHVAFLGISGLQLNGATLEVFLNDLAPNLERLELRSWSDTFSVSKWTAFRKLDQPLFPLLTNLLVKGLPPIYLYIRCEVFLKLFELNCPRLESMAWDIDGWTLFGVSEFVYTLANAIQQRDTTISGGGSGGCCWPRLDSIKIDDVYHGNMSYLPEDDFTELLSACRDLKLRRLNIMVTSLWTKSFRALEPHFGTLEVLHLTTASWQTQRILSSCPRLRVLTGGVLEAYDVVQGLGAEAKRLTCATNRSKWMRREEEMLLNSAPIPWSDPLKPPLPWVCHGLQILKLPIVKMRTGDERSNLQILDRLLQLRELREVNIASRSPYNYISSYWGLNRRTYVEYPGIDLDPNLDWEVVGRQAKPCTNPHQIQSWVPIGPKLLEFWPNLTHCHLNT